MKKYYFSIMGDDPSPIIDFFNKNKRINKIEENWHNSLLLAHNSSMNPYNWSLIKDRKCLSNKKPSFLVSQCYHHNYGYILQCILITNIK